MPRVKATSAGPVPFTPEEEAFADNEEATRTADRAIKDQRRAEAAQIKADNQVRQIINASPTQIDNWIDNNVTNLAEAKELFKRLAKAISAIGREAFVN